MQGLSVFVVPAEYPPGTRSVTVRAEGGTWTLENLPPTRRRFEPRPAPRANPLPGVALVGEANATAEGRGLFASVRLDRAPGERRLHVLKVDAMDGLWGPLDEGAPGRADHGSEGPRPWTDAVALFDAARLPTPVVRLRGWVRRLTVEEARGVVPAREVRRAADGSFRLHRPMTLRLSNGGPTLRLEDDGHALRAPASLAVSAFWDDSSGWSSLQVGEVPLFDVSDGGDHKAYARARFGERASQRLDARRVARGVPVVLRRLTVAAEAPFAVVVPVRPETAPYRAP